MCLALGIARGRFPYIVSPWRWDRWSRHRPRVGKARNWGGMSKALACLGAGLVAALAFLPNPLFAQGYESPPTLSAAKVLPPDVLQSPYHKIV